jgi:hypothetical protein
MKLNSVLLIFVFALAVFSRPLREPWKPSDLLQPAALSIRLGAGEKPMIVQVGFNVLYRAKHIPGAIFAGPASQPDGIALLKNAMKGVDPKTEVIIYCGCCPMKDCPNLRPAFKTLADMGYHNVKVLELDDNFSTDWIEQGYQVEKGSPK